MRVSLALLLTLPFLVSSSKILFLGYPAYSHLRSMTVIGDLLVERGHDVWISATSGLSKKFNLPARNMKTIPFGSESTLTECLDSMPVQQYLTTGRRSLFSSDIKNLSHIMLTDELFMSTIKNIKFDLVVLDIIPIANMLNLIPYKFDIPFVYYGPAYLPFQWRIPYSPAFIPFPLLGFSDKMTFSQRLVSTIVNVAFAVYDPFSYYRSASIYAPEKPYLDIHDIMLKAQLFLWERNEFLEYPSPIMPHVKPLSLATSQSKAVIPPEYKNFMDKSKHGVIVVSFGSLVPAGNVTIFQKLVKAFENTKYDLIIKGSFAKSNNRMWVSDWIPQNALLSHPKVKLFVTHCGANGLGEAIANGVPMLGLPIFAEQPANANLMMNREFGLSLELWDTTSEIILETMHEVIDNPKYKINVKRAASLHKELSKKQNSTEEAAYWIEHVIKFGGEHFRSSSIDMPLYQYLLLDVLAFIGLVLVVVIFVLLKCIRCCINFCRTKKSKRD